MSRRLGFLLAFIVFTAIVLWYASAYIQIPEVTFAEAAKIEDSKKKVMIPGKVVMPDKITVQGATATFYMIDSDSARTKVSYQGTDAFTAGQLQNAAKKGATISVAGHSHGDYFHASQVLVPAY